MRRVTRESLFARGWFMAKRAGPFTAFFFLLSVPGLAQTPSGGQDFTYTISTTQVWTDTGLDLQAGEMLQISTLSAASSVPDRHAVPGVAVGCDPKGVSGSAAPGPELPLPTAAPGALIARLHAQGANPIAISASGELPITEPSHLFLGVNAAGTPPCQGSLTVKVHRAQGTSNPDSQAASTGSSASGTGEAQSKSRGEQLKSQLSTAAQIFMAGQFGTGKSETNAVGTSNATSGGTAASGEASNTAPALVVSDSPLDAELCKDIDGLPRRVNDQFKNLGDMVNFVIVGNEKDVQAALAAANWHPADTDSKKAVLNAVLETYEKKDYLQMPMSTLYLYGRPQDFGYEQAEPIAMVASRHHFRIWKAPLTWEEREVWIGAGPMTSALPRISGTEALRTRLTPRSMASETTSAAACRRAARPKRRITICLRIPCGKPEMPLETITTPMDGCW